MEKPTETAAHILTGLWFKWIAWLSVSAALLALANKSGSFGAFVLVLISTGLCSWSIGYTAVELGLNSIAKNPPPPWKSILIILMLSMPLLIVYVLHSLFTSLLLK